jgi:hypothetical protein
LLVRIQVDRITRDQVSPLACFRIDGKAKDGIQHFLHFVGPLNLIIQSVITQGRPARIRNHAEGEEQPNGEDQEQALLQSG